MALGYVTSVFLSATLSAAIPESRESAEATANSLLESVEQNIAFASGGTCNDPDREIRLRLVKATHERLMAEFERITSHKVYPPIILLEGDECSYERNFDGSIAEAQDALRAARLYIRKLR